MSIIDYGDEQTRDGLLPEGDTEVIGNEKCSARSYKMEDVTPPAYRIAPDGEDSQYLLVVNGAEAESKRMYLNLCDKSRGSSSTSRHVCRGHCRSGSGVACWVLWEPGGGGGAGVGNVGVEKRNDGDHHARR